MFQLPDRESILGPLQQVMETRLDVMKKVSKLQGRLNLIFAQVTAAIFVNSGGDYVLFIVGIFVRLYVHRIRWMY